MSAEQTPAGAEGPLLDAAWLKVLDVLATNGIGCHSLGIVFERGRGWGVEVVFASVGALEAAGAALGLGSTEDVSRVGLRRRGMILGLPVTCWCWKRARKGLELPQDPPPPGSGRAKSRGYVPTADPGGGQLDLLDLAAAP